MNIHVLFLILSAQQVTPSHHNALHSSSTGIYMTLPVLPV